MKNKMLKYLAAATLTSTLINKSNTSSYNNKTKIAFVYIGPVADSGWTYEHDQARKAIVAKFGDKIETMYVIAPERPDSERVMTDMAPKGADLIFTTTFDYMDPTINVVAKFPDVKFENVIGYMMADNVSVYAARSYEGRAIQGHKTKSNIFGYIGSFPIPEVIRGINVAYIHAKDVSPEVQLKIIWAYTWFDPSKEADAAKVLIEQVADVFCNIQIQPQHRRLNRRMEK